MSPRIPKPGTYPSTCIREGSHGPNDPAVKNWDTTFGPHKCGACKHYPGAGKECKARSVSHLVENEEQEGCYSAFERKG